MKSLTIALFLLLGGFIALTSAAPDGEKLAAVIADEERIQAKRHVTHRFVLCEGQTSTLGCHGSKRLRILYANYGRRNRSDCRRTWLMGNTNCHSSYAKRLIRGACDGHNSCRLSANNGVFGDPCPWTHKYIEVSYQCR